MIPIVVAILQEVLQERFPKVAEETISRAAWDAYEALKEEDCLL